MDVLYHLYICQFRVSAHENVFTITNSNRQIWATFLVIDIRCNLRLMILPILLRVSKWTKYWYPTMWEIGVGRLVHARSRCSWAKGASSHQGPSKSHNVCFGITYRFIPTHEQSNTIIHAPGNIEVVFLSLCGESQIIMVGSFISWYLWMPMFLNYILNRLITIHNMYKRPTPWVNF